jgi:hypothetical protein
VCTLVHVERVCVGQHPPLTPLGTLVHERARKFDGKVMADEASVARRWNARDCPVELLLVLSVSGGAVTGARELPRTVRPDLPIGRRVAAPHLSRSVRAFGASRLGADRHS